MDYHNEFVRGLVQAMEQAMEKDMERAMEKELEREQVLVSEVEQELVLGKAQELAPVGSHMHWKHLHHRMLASKCPNHGSKEPCHR